MTRTDLPQPAAAESAMPPSIQRLATLLLALAVAIMLVVNLVNVGQPLLEEHAFRQTQTALTAHYLQLNGFSLRYETPVLGEPWSIPFEFPLYQAIVALISSALGVSLSVTGRVVSLAFTLLACVPIHAMLARLRLDRAAIHFALALFLTSPIYLFWAGTFMIESAALCFTCAFLYHGLKLLQRDFGNRDLIFGAIFLALALLQKVTTALPPLALMLGIGLYSLHRQPVARWNGGLALRIAASVLLPLALGLAWVKFSDAVKMDNPIGSALTSASLAQWNYGTLAQRLSAKLWSAVIYGRVVKKTAFLGLGLIVALVALARLRDVAPRRLIAAALVLFFLPFLLFTNLHMVHSYYQSANGVFLSIAVGVASVYLGRQILPCRPRLLAALLVASVLSNLAFFGGSPFRLKTVSIEADDPRLVLTDYVKQHTAADQPVIWYGYDWSSEPAFYSERKSLTVPNWGNLELAVLERTGDYLSRPPAAIVLCPVNGREEALRAAIARHHPQLSARQVGGCEVYLAGQVGP